MKSLLISYVSYVCRTLAKKETFQATPKAAVVDAPVANISNIKLSEPPSYKKGFLKLFIYSTTLKAKINFFNVLFLFFKVTNLPLAKLMEQLWLKLARIIPESVVWMET